MVLTLKLNTTHFLQHCELNMVSCRAHRYYLKYFTQAGKNNKFKQNKLDTKGLQNNKGKLTGCFFIYCNINGRDLQRKHVVNSVNKSSLWAP